MAILFRQTPAKWRADGFKHKALAYGFIPVYMSHMDDAVPVVATRNWFPDWPLDLMGWLHGFFHDIVDPYGLTEPEAWFSVTGEI